MNFLVNEIIAQMDKEAVAAKIKPGSSSSLRESIVDLLAKENSRVPAERQVSQKAAFTVASRSLNNTAGLDSKSRFFAAYRDVASFLSLAIDGKSPVNRTRHTDLLPVGHPLSSRGHAMSASAYSHAVARWIAADPRIDNSVREIVAAAYAYPVDSVESMHANTRLRSLTAGLVPQEFIVNAGLTPIIAVGIGGNSSIAKSIRARMQRRDRNGQFAEQGGGMQFFFRGLDGLIHSIIGRFVANNDSDGYHIEVKGDSNLKDGIYSVPATQAAALKAVLPDSAVPKPKGETDVKLPSDVDAVDASEIQSVDSPNGWELVSKQKEHVWDILAGGPEGPNEVYKTGDGYRVDVYFPDSKETSKAVNKAWKLNTKGGAALTDPPSVKNADGDTKFGSKLDKTQPVYILHRDKTEVTGEKSVAIVQSWADVQEYIEKDEKSFEADYEAALEVKSKQAKGVEESKAKSEAYIKQAEEVMKANEQTRAEIESNLAKGLDPWGKEIPEGWEVKKNDSALNPGWSSKIGDKEYVNTPIKKEDAVSYTRTEQGYTGEIGHNADGSLVGLYQDQTFDNWDDANAAFSDEVQTDVEARREAAMDAIAPYDEDGDLVDMVNNGATGDEILDTLNGRSKEWMAELEDYETKGFVDLPQKAQKDKWDAFKKKFDAIKNLPPEFKPFNEEKEVKAVIEPKQEEKTVEVPKTTGAVDWVTPDGAYKLKVAAFEPEGRFDEASSDFTDDPKVLANKFSTDDLSAALAQALRGKKDVVDEILEELDKIPDIDEGDGKPGPKKGDKNKPKKVEAASGYGSLEFNEGDEYVPAEAIYLALEEQGVDAKLISAQLYDLGTGESVNVDAISGANNEQSVGMQEPTALIDALDLDPNIFKAHQQLAEPSIAAGSVAQMNDLVANGDDNPNFKTLADDVKKLSSGSDGYKQILDKYIEWAYSDDPDKKAAFRGVWGLLLALDGNSTDAMENDTSLYKAVEKAISKYDGSSVAPNKLSKFFDDFGYIDELIQSKINVANGTESLNDPESLAGSFYRLVAQLSGPNDKVLYRGIDLKDGSALLEEYTTEGGIISIDPRSFTDEKITAGGYAKAFGANQGSSIIFTIDKGMGQSIDVSGISMFGEEREHIAWGDYKIVSVASKPLINGEGTLYNVKLEKATQRDLVLNGYNDDYAGFLQENNVVDLPEGFYSPSPETYEPTTDKDASLPKEFDDSPLTIARYWESADLIEAYRGSIEDGSGKLLLKYPIDGGYDASIESEAVRDALQIQGIDTNALLNDIANASPTAGPSNEEKEVFEASTESPIDEIANDIAEEGDLSGFKQVGPQQGSNKGGTFEDAEGNQFYVKEPKSDLHAQNEVLASALYRAVGIDAAEIYIGSNEDGKKKTYSPMIDGAESDLSTKRKDSEYLAKLQEGFAIDAWLANWDVAGLSFDNVVTDANGDPVRVDPGGALLFRAMGAPKGSAFGDEVTELETLRDKNKNPQSAALFGSMTEEQQVESARKLLDITPDEISQLVDSIVDEPNAAAKLKDTLVARRSFILDRYGLLADDTSITVDNTDISDTDADAAKPAVNASEDQLDTAFGWAEEYRDLAKDAGFEKDSKQFDEIANQIDVALVDYRNGDITDEQLPTVLDELTTFIETYGWEGDEVTRSNAEDLADQISLIKNNIKPSESVVEETPKPEVPSESPTNPYVTADGVPIEPGMKLKYKKTGEVVDFIKYDKGNSSYVYVKGEGDAKPKVKSTKQLVSVGNDGGGGGGGTEPTTPTPSIPQVSTPEEIKAIAESPDGGITPSANDDVAPLDPPRTLDFSSDLQPQVQDAIDKQKDITFFYNGKVRKIKPVSIWENKKNGNLNVYSYDYADDKVKNFTLQNFKDIPEGVTPEVDVSVPEKPAEKSAPFSSPEMSKAKEAVAEFFKNGIDDNAEILAINEKINAIAFTPDGQDAYVYNGKTGEIIQPESKPDWFKPSGIGAQTFSWRELTAEEQKSIKDAIDEKIGNDDGSDEQPDETPEEVGPQSEEQAPPSPPAGAVTITDSNGNQVYTGVEVTDKKGNTGTVKKVNQKDNYALVKFPDGSEGWRSGKTLSTTGNIKEGATSPSTAPKIKASKKATGAGVPKILVQKNVDWTETDFDKTPSLLDAISIVQNPDDKSAGMRGASTAVDSDSIEDLDVRLMRVKDETGADGVQLKFKLTNWASKDRIGSILKMSPEEQKANGVEVGPLKVDRIDVLPDGSGQINAEKTAFSSNTGRLYTIRTADGIVIKIHRANSTDTDKFESSYYSKAPKAFHNLVTIQAPASATPEQIANALAVAGVVDVRPATKDDGRILIENRLMSIFDAQTNANINLKGDKREQSLSRIKEKWGITPDDVIVTTGASGRIETRLSPEGAKKIWEATGKPAAIQHNLSMHGVSGGEDGAAEWLANLFSTPQGGLLSTTTRWTEGIGTQGMSSQSDVGTGGADYVFTKPVMNASAKTYGITGMAPHLYFDPLKLYERLDFYANQNDAYGKRSPNKDVISAAKVGAYEVMFKHRISWEDLDVAVLSPTMRTILLGKLKDRGITQIGGRPIEDVFVLGTKNEQ